MANQEQLEILKAGCEVWNKWRDENRRLVIDLSRANLSDADLVGADLSEADLSEADLSRADLSRADLSRADLYEANLYEASLYEASLNSANLSKASLVQAGLIGADLTKAILREAILRNVNLSSSYLVGADLSEADLIGADLIGADLNEANLSEAWSSGTVFTNIDLSNTKGLELMKHIGASSLGTDTLIRSKGKIPDIFLRGCGLSNWEIEAAKLYDPKLSNDEINKALYRIYDLRAIQPLQISPLFISYNHTDSGFVDRMEKSLNSKGVRFWRDIHHATAGKLEKQVDRAIRHNPTVLVILSKNSIESDWVEHEVNLARKLEKETKRDVLCPVALDDGWKTSQWSEVIMEQVKKYNILDFSIWKDDAKFEKMFVRLIDGLDLYYKK